jgi:hypothetical protein
MKSHTVLVQHLVLACIRPSTVFALHFWKSPRPFSDGWPGHPSPLLEKKKKEKCFIAYLSLLTKFDCTPVFRPPRTPNPSPSPNRTEHMNRKKYEIKMKTKGQAARSPPRRPARALLRYAGCSSPSHIPIIMTPHSNVRRITIAPHAKNVTTSYRTSRGSINCMSPTFISPCVWRGYTLNVRCGPFCSGVAMGSQSQRAIVPSER